MKIAICLFSLTAKSVLVKDTPLHIQQKLAEIKAKGFDTWREANSQNSTLESTGEGMDRRRPESSGFDWFGHKDVEEEEEPCPEFEVPMPEDLDEICKPCEDSNWVPEDCELEPGLGQTQAEVEYKLGATSCLGQTNTDVYADRRQKIYKCENGCIEGSCHDSHYDLNNQFKKCFSIDGHIDINDQFKGFDASGLQKVGDMAASET